MIDQNTEDNSMKPKVIWMLCDCCMTSQPWCLKHDMHLSDCKCGYVDEEEIENIKTIQRRLDVTKEDPIEETGSDLEQSGGVGEGAIW